jgi:hypothetical protein
MYQIVLRGATDGHGLMKTEICKLEAFREPVDAEHIILYSGADITCLNI